MDSYDFVIVGAGSAGTVLANRLSADGTKTVCLLEAGPSDRTPLIHVPSFVGTLMFNPKYSWGYQTVPQSQLGGRSIPLPRGRVLGGCSSTNGMVYFRGHPMDFDEWSQWGCEGWGFSEVLPYFKRSEDNLDYRDSPWHGTGGEMAISHVRDYSPMINPFLEATVSLGYPRCDDFNGCVDPVGFDVRQNALAYGRRVSGVTAFLAPARKRPNLQIMTQVLVDRIELDRGHASGVYIRADGITRLIHAKREVILCGGAYGSPQVLERSGIGDPEILQEHGIAVKVALKQVGKNLHDHPSSVVQMATSNTDSYGISWPALPRNAWSVVKYLFNRRGQLAGNLFEVTGFVRTSPELDRPDLQFVFMPATRPTPKFPFPIGHGFGINAILLRPKSRGTVHISAVDPAAKPLIDNQFLAATEDQDTLLKGLKISRQILAQDALGKYKANEILPGAELKDDQELKAYMRSQCTAVHHPGGSCRMGNDSESVVDPQLRLRGVHGLRIVDASIYPRVVSGNTNASVVMIAEKAADMILGKPALKSENPVNG